MFRKKILSILCPVLGEDFVLERPSKPELGDYSLACFQFAKKFKKSPEKIACDLAASLKKPDFIEKIESVNGYLNFFIKPDFLIKEVLSKIKKEESSFGSSSLGKGKNVMVEFSSPNTNKPMHLGHIRTNLLGDCLSNIFSFQGYNVIRANLVNDRGIHICKSMLAYMKFGDGETPESSGIKGDHFIGKYYVLYQKKLAEFPELDGEARELLKKWESGDKEVCALWKKMNEWCVDGFNETYKKQGIKFDKIYFESDYWLKAKNIVLDYYKKGVFVKGDDGEIVAKLDKFGLPDKVVLRADGTALYVTQDIDLAIKKFSDFDLDKSIYVVAREQDLHFKQLFAVLNLMGFKWWNNCFHYSYGMVNLPEGKMKSREGKVVDSDDLLLEMEDLAKDEILKRHSDLKEEVLHDRAHAIGLAALRFFMLKIDANKDMVFDPKKAIPFEGDTGPYAQYSYARICSILRKSEKECFSESVDYSLLKDSFEIALVKKLGEFPEIVFESCRQLKPHLIAQYLIDFCRIFNVFYQNCNCLNVDDELKCARIDLVYCSKIVLKNALSIFGIAALDEM
jgi:arginyl-tRNA synthetase